MFFSQNALQGFTEQTVGSGACVGMEPPVTGPAENVYVPADGWGRPVSWVRHWEVLHRNTGGISPITNKLLTVVLLLSM